MKILQIFGAVIAVHVLAFIFIFASPGCSSSPRNIPTPDATAPTAGTSTAPASSGVAYTPSPVDLGTGSTYTPPSQAGRAEPTRPGSPNAAAITPAKAPSDDVAPVSTYTVTRGDSLWSIAKKNRLTVVELAKANNLSAGATLQPGKKLIIPAKAPAPQDLAAAPASTTKAIDPRSGPARNNEALHHTIQSGESLGTIARKYQVTVGELAAANNITDPAKIRAGQQLVIPGFKAVGNNSRPANNTATKSSPATQAPAQTPAQTEPTVTTPRFEITPPPPGQDLDAGLKDTATDVPTIKVEEPKPKS